MTEGTQESIPGCEPVTDPHLAALGRKFAEARDAWQERLPAMIAAKEELRAALIAAKCWEYNVEGVTIKRAEKADAITVTIKEEGEDEE